MHFMVGEVLAESRLRKHRDVVTREDREEFPILFWDDAVEVDILGIEPVETRDHLLRVREIPVIGLQQHRKGVHYWGPLTASIMPAEQRNIPRQLPSCSRSTQPFRYSVAPIFSVSMGGAG